MKSEPSLEGFGRACIIAVGLAVLAYCGNGLMVGRIYIKGVRYTVDEPIGFAFGIATAATFAIMALGFALAYPWMLSPMQVGMVRLLQGLAAGARVITLFVVTFATCLVLAYARLR